ncbi:gamma carbonic anhydrase family protein [Elusimicrobiota bacterium]
MIIKYLDYKPEIHPSVYIAENTAIIGSVKVEANSSIFPGSVLRADVCHIHIGEDTNVQDGSLIHVNYDMPTLIGKGVTIGHGVILHGCKIGDNCLIGMGAIILDGAVIENNCIVGAGALIAENTHIPKGNLVLGLPGKIIRPLNKEEILKNEKSANEYKEFVAQYKKSTK